MSGIRNESGDHLRMMEMSFGRLLDDLAFWQGPEHQFGYANQVRRAAKFTPGNGGQAYVFVGVGDDANPIAVQAENLQLPERICQEFNWRRSQYQGAASRQ